MEFDFEEFLNQASSNPKNLAPNSGGFDDDFLLNWNPSKLKCTDFDFGAQSTSNLKKFDIGNEIDFDLESNLSKFNIDLDGLGDFAPSKSSKTQTHEDPKSSSDFSKSFNKDPDSNSRKPTLNKKNSNEIKFQPEASKEKDLEDKSYFEEFQVKDINPLGECKIPMVPKDNGKSNKVKETEASKNQVDSSTRIHQNHSSVVENQNEMEIRKDDHEPLLPKAHGSFQKETPKVISIPNFKDSYASVCDASKPPSPFKVPPLPKHVLEKKLYQKSPKASSPMKESSPPSESCNTVNEHQSAIDQSQENCVATETEIAYKRRNKVTPIEKNVHFSTNKPIQTMQSTISEEDSKIKQNEQVIPSLLRPVTDTNAANSENPICKESIDHISMHLDEENPSISNRKGEKEDAGTEVCSEPKSNYLDQVKNNPNQKDSIPSEPLEENSVTNKQDIKLDEKSNVQYQHTHERQSKPINTEMNEKNSKKVNLKPLHLSIKHFSLPKLKKLGPIFPSPPSPLIPLPARNSLDSKAPLFNTKRSNNSNRLTESKMERIDLGEMKESNFKSLQPSLYESKTSSKEETSVSMSTTSKEEYENKKKISSSVDEEKKSMEEISNSELNSRPNSEPNPKPNSEPSFEPSSEPNFEPNLNQKVSNPELNLAGINFKNDFQKEKEKEEEEKEKEKEESSPIKQDDAMEIDFDSNSDLNPSISKPNQIKFEKSMSVLSLKRLSMNNQTSSSKLLKSSFIKDKDKSQPSISKNDPNSDNIFSIEKDIDQSNVNELSNPLSDVKEPSSLSPPSPSPPSPDANQLSLTVVEDLTPEKKMESEFRYEQACRYEEGEEGKERREGREIEGKENEDENMIFETTKIVIGNGNEDPNESMYYYLKQMNDESQSLLVKAMISANRTCMLNSSNYLHYIASLHESVEGMLHQLGISKERNLEE